MYGTIARWVQTIGKWNPRLSEQDCFAVVKCVFGLQLPTVHTLRPDLEMGFPEEFFSEVVYTETRRCVGCRGRREQGDRLGFDGESARR